MFRHFVAIAWRNIRRERIYSAINLIGLTVGLASGLFILSLIIDELSFDRFHRDADRIYRISTLLRLGSQEEENLVVGAGFADALLQEFPEVESAVRMYTYLDHVFRYEDKTIPETSIAYVDSTFFDVFSFRLLEGDPVRSLAGPYSMVITPDIARKYFGEAPAIGELISVEGYEQPFRVTGIMEKMPQNSHFRFDILFSMSSFEPSHSGSFTAATFFAYFRLQEGADPDLFESKLQILVEKYFLPEVETQLGMDVHRMQQDGARFEYRIQPLTRIRLYSKTAHEMQGTGDIRYLRILGLVAVFILTVAAINFMNLSTARSARRALEVGIRKTLGSPRRQLIVQFLCESMVYSALAFLLALLVVAMLLPEFNDLIGKSIEMHLLWQGRFVLAAIALVILLGLLAGSYPAFYLTSMPPVDVLKGMRTGSRENGRLRNGLVIAQFFIAVSLISFTWLIFRQVQYLRSRDLGMQSEQVMCIAVGNRLGNSLPAFRYSLEELAAVKRTTSVRSVPPAHPGDTSFEPRNSHQVRNFSLNTVDGSFLAALEIPLLAGRNFVDEHPADSATIILNETAVRELGWDPELPETVIGQTVEFTPHSYRRDRVAAKIIGICRDFHFEQLHRPLRPLALQHGINEPWLLVKLQTAELSQSVEKIESIWKKLAPGNPFQYHFMDESFDAAFRGELMLGRFFSLLTGITTLVASLGLFGLSVFITERKTREIGIRKTAGATDGHILYLLGTGFIRPVLIAFLLAVPVSYFLMQWWLRSFVYRTPVTASIFLITGTGAVVIALLTVAFQSWKAARITPAKALRHE